MSTRVTTGQPTITDSSIAAATGWRMWVPVVVMMSCSCLSYIDRQALTVISPTILHDTGLSASSYAYIGAIFSILYMASNFFWGAWLDYIGLRVGMLLAVGIWTLASVSHAWVGGFVGFAAARALLGFGEGATFPGGLRTAANSLPLGRQSRGMGISYSGASVGAIVAPLVIVPIALKFGWRAAFIFTGALGAVWFMVWWFVARPPLVHAAERKASGISWPNIFERRFWMLVVGMGLGGSALGIVLYLCPIYLNRALGLSQSQLGKILWIPAICWEFGYYFWGWISDRWVRDNIRPVPLYLLLTILALVPCGVTRTSSWALALAQFSWAMFIAVGFIVVSLHVAARMYPREETGKVAGIGSGAWSAVVALLLLAYGPWLDRQMYASIFLTLSLVPILGTALWWWIGRAGTAETIAAGGNSPA
jgi:ACS family hexuronate transporter-like MFS transporter